MENLSKGQRLPNVLHAVMLLLVFVALIWVLPDLPDQLPMHFSPDGSVDRYGSSQELWVLFILWFITAGALYAISLAPSLTNTPKSLKSKEARLRYQHAMLPALAWVNFWTGMLMVSIIAGIISMAMGWITHLTPLIWPQMGLYLALLAWHIWRGHTRAMREAEGS